VSTDGVGGAGNAGSSNNTGSVGGASESTAADPANNGSVDAAIGDVSDAEVAGAAASVTEAADGFDAEAKAAKEEQAADLCIGTRDECAQKRADAMSEEEAIEALDGSFLHDPRDLSPSQVKGLEALSEAPHLSDRAKDAIRGFLEDHRNGVDRLGIDGHLGRPDAIDPKDIPRPDANVI